MNALLHDHALRALILGVVGEEHVAEDILVSLVQLVEVHAVAVSECHPPEYRCGGRGA